MRILYGHWYSHHDIRPGVEKHGQTVSNSKNQRIKSLLSLEHDKVLEMKSRLRDPGKQGRVTTLLLGPVDVRELIGSTDTGIDEKELMLARQCLVLKAQKHRHTMRGTPSYIRM